MQTEIVHVPLGNRSYDIEIGTDNLSQVASMLTSFEPISHCEVLTDENVSPLYAARIADSIHEQGFNVDLRVVAAGEGSKSIATAEAVWDAMLEDGVDRKSLVLAIGGGVIGDLAGFVAATFARGIRFFQVPTTLLAQVDSSVGGKVGVNLEKAKNMVGAFHQPIAVLIDTSTLKTLSQQEYLSGLGEVVKYAESLDAPFFDLLASHVALLNERDPVFLRQVIARCCQIKADIVVQDERETSGLRAKLNYGHTFGHAIETLCGHGTVPHGLAVSIGSICAARVANRLGLIDQKTVEQMMMLHSSLGLPIDWVHLPPGPLHDPQEWIKVMMRDKKTEHGRLHLVLPTGLGMCEIRDGIDPELIIDVLRE
ncbi:MAG: 3-dehydroquinate synthase [Thermoguttaceae bacterium]